MLEKLAKSAARFFVAQNIVKSEYQEIYAYGMEILLSTMVNGIIVLIISILSDTVLPSLIFFTAFIVMRSSAGGYHAKTHIGCMLILIAVHLSFIFLIRFITIDAIPLFCIRQPHHPPTKRAGQSRPDSSIYKQLQTTASYCK